jgi:hypothetical protein
MIRPTHQEMLKALAELCSLSPDVRFGQLLANLSMLAEDQVERSIWEIEDEQLLAIIEQHRRDLAKRHSNVA